MIQISILESDDLVQGTDWCRPLEIRPENPCSDSYSFKSMYGGTPINNAEWVQVRHIFGKGWFNHSVAEINSMCEECTQYEFIRGIPPKKHQLNLKNYNV